MQFGLNTEGENRVLKNLKICTFNKHYWGRQDKGYEVGRVCITHGKLDKHTKNLKTDDCSKKRLVRSRPLNMGEIFFLWRCGLTWSMASSFLKFLDLTQLRITIGRTPLDAWSARRRDLYLTTHNTHNRQTSMPPVVFEPTVPAGERPQTYALDRAATWTGIGEIY